MKVTLEFDDDGWAEEFMRLYDRRERLEANLRGSVASPYAEAVKKSSESVNEARDVLRKLRDDTARVLAEIDGMRAQSDAETVGGVAKKLTKDGVPRNIIGLLLAHVPTADLRKLLG